MSHNSLAGLQQVSMKAADIPDDLFLEGVRELSVRPPWGSPSQPWWVMRYQIDAWLSERLGVEIPWKVSLAKARKLIKRGLLKGCGCGCRGDYEIPRGAEAQGPPSSGAGVSRGAG